MLQDEFLTNSEKLIPIQARNCKVLFKNGESLPKVLPRLLLSRFLVGKGKGRSFCSLPAFENLLEDLGGEELAASMETLQPCIHRSS